MGKIGDYQTGFPGSEKAPFVASAFEMHLALSLADSWPLFCIFILFSLPHSHCRRAGIFAGSWKNERWMAGMGRRERGEHTTRHWPRKHICFIRFPGFLQAWAFFFFLTTRSMVILYVYV
ncbi:hypothetical protein B0T19DRAFT_32373 [Cercophora scortea]|uniref:Uncharacterized protein n=1 Tax=Cercophora scortea TaxID=314031 RepID=A0AAE0MKV1_9PEZI|nr:hypothetical protein B0T19DRAFT_32373 [Cercophora scortea]